MKKQRTNLFDYLKQDTYYSALVQIPDWTRKPEEAIIYWDSKEDDTSTYNNFQLLFPTKEMESIQYTNKDGNITVFCVPKYSIEKVSSDYFKDICKKIKETANPYDSGITYKYINTPIYIYSAYPYKSLEAKWINLENWSLICKTPIGSYVEVEQVEYDQLFTSKMYNDKEHLEAAKVLYNYILIHGILDKDLHQIELHYANILLDKLKDIDKYIISSSIYSIDKFDEDEYEYYDDRFEDKYFLQVKSELLDLINLTFISKGSVNYDMISKFHKLDYDIYAGEYDSFGPLTMVFEIPDKGVIVFG